MTVVGVRDPDSPPGPGANECRNDPCPNVDPSSETSPPPPVCAPCRKALAHHNPPLRGILQMTRSAAQRTAQAWHPLCPVGLSSMPGQGRSLHGFQKALRWMLTFRSPRRLRRTSVQTSTCSSLVSSLLYAAVLSPKAGSQIPASMTSPGSCARTVAFCDLATTSKAR